jgi:hypothetical protein
VKSDAPATQQPAANRLATWQIVLGVLLASTSGAAILAHTFLAIPMSFTAPAIVLPTAALLVAAVLLRRRLHARLVEFSTLVWRGGVAGLSATLVYDVVRPPITWAFGLTFDPYRAMPIFGQLMTGLRADDPTAIVAGWIYHFWNGISFGVMFALVRPRGGLLSGWAWSMVLQGLMMAAYPAFLKARLDDPGFLATGLVGHSLWGLVLGGMLQRWGPLETQKTPRPE